MNRLAARSLILLGLLAAHACGGPADPIDRGLAAGRGAIAGTVYFIGVPCPPTEARKPPCDGPYPDYEVVVYRIDGKTRAALTRSDGLGRYYVELKPGAYVIFTQNGIDARIVARNEATVVADEVTSLDLVVDTGIR